MAIRNLSDLTTMAKAIETAIDGARVIGIIRGHDADIIRGDVDENGRPNWYIKMPHDGSIEIWVRPLNGQWETFGDTRDAVDAVAVLNTFINQ